YRNHWSFSTPLFHNEQWGLSAVNHSLPFFGILKENIPEPAQPEQENEDERRSRILKYVHLERAIDYREEAPYITSPDQNPEVVACNVLQIWIGLTMTTSEKNGSFTK